MNLRSSTLQNDRILSWEELDGRPLPQWYDQSKFGIFLHWGVFSVPALCSEWFGTYWRDHWGPCPYIGQLMNETERPSFSYQEFARRFQAELFNATEWSLAFAKAGAQYVVLTSKHHDGYCMWDSRDSVPTTWHWNVMDVGPRRDLLGELAEAVKNASSRQTGESIKFGVYHSLYEWFNPMYLQDRKNNFTTDHFVTMKTIAELKDLVMKYSPELIWSDGEWEAHSDYWRSREFLTWYSQTIQTGIWNDRWGTDTLCMHGGFLTCADRYEPGRIVDKKWENAMTIDRSSWGYNRASPFENYLTTKELIDTLIETVAYNGNLLLNIGPSADGTMDPIFLDRLQGIGAWLDVNGQAIYKTAPWAVCQSEHPQDQNKTTSAASMGAAYGAYYTRSSDVLYVHLTQWPSGSSIQLDCPEATSATVVSLLGYEHPGATLPRLRKTSGQGVVIDLPMLTPDVIPSQHAWVLKMTNVANLDDKPFYDSKKRKSAQNLAPNLVEN
eukprot:CAMPEP_0168748758 /NCGR_PEP_ID=MMETSP0724-20121128/16343_1 /TAXON_ID=265536 /ORGANISM="Amphiprora sp., Strain CCMP467" /LENGTH=496 /DNA_ID=CAMNT_0008796601 /DNA_START=61 /DNA_END=1551 /DNA_ORIENTATION=+